MWLLPFKHLAIQLKDILQIWLSRWSYTKKKKKKYSLISNSNLESSHKTEISCLIYRECDLVVFHIMACMMCNLMLKENILYMVSPLVFHYLFNWIHWNKSAALVAVSNPMCFAEFSVLPKVNARSPCRSAARSRNMSPFWFEKYDWVFPALHARLSPAFELLCVWVRIIHSI